MITTQIDEGNFAPNVKTFASTDVIPDALILQTSTVAGNVEGDAAVVSALYVDDTQAGFVPEGSPIGQSDPAMSSVAVRTGKIGTLLKVSRELWQTTGVSEQLATSVSRSITKAANSAYLTQAAPVAPAITPPAGILSDAGLTAAAAPISGDLDGLVDLLATLEAKGATPSHILIDPIGWAALRKLKSATDSNLSLLGAGVVDSAHLLLDVPVIVTNAMPASSGLVVDKSAIVSVVGPVSISNSEHLYFDSDTIAVRATWRFGATPVRPERLGTFTVAAD